MYRPLLAISLTAGLAWLAPNAIAPAAATDSFTRISSFPIFKNLPAGTDPTSAVPAARALPRISAMVPFIRLAGFIALSPLLVSELEG